MATDAGDHLGRRRWWGRVRWRRPLLGAVAALALLIGGVLALWRQQEVGPDYAPVVPLPVIIEMTTPAGPVPCPLERVTAAAGVVSGR
ncbi:hypothetical protein [Nocardia transvalensis]|uniref:hypothetical protein n=1 Tax=Nocardia transvalensis TaxID=37333 RepID=UPI001893DF74|nr:hypothetical protein [Nocardia transvalensis]MBF6328405.1 hypothetical protein [Nocardia transvalensis]